MDTLQTTGDEARSETAEPEKPKKELELSKPEELWAMAMKLIEAENGLINHRLTWFLGIQAFLAAALGLIVGNPRFESIQTPAILMIGAFGWSFVAVLAPGILAARRQITAADSWLKKARSDSGYAQRCPYPPPKGIKADTRILKIRVPGTPKEELYDPIYEFTDHETQPDYKQFGFANFPDVIFVFWTLVIGWVLLSPWFPGAGSKSLSTVLTVPATSSANPSVAVTDPKTGETIARVSIGEVAPKRVITIELQDSKPAGGK